jgi:hypothetical protein
VAIADRFLHYPQKADGIVGIAGFLGLHTIFFTIQARSKCATEKPALRVAREASGNAMSLVVVGYCD